MTLVKWNREGRSNGSPSYGNGRNNLMWPELFEQFLRPFPVQDFFDEGLGTGKSLGTTLPPVNIHESDNELTIEMAAPGMRKENFKIDLNDNQLNIRYQDEKKEEEKKSGSQWRKEYSFESFERTFALPAMIMQDNIEANYTDGILRITLPKKEEARKKPARAINIK